MRTGGGQKIPKFCGRHTWKPPYAAHPFTRSWLCWQSPGMHVALLIHDISIEMTSIPFIRHHGKGREVLLPNIFYGKNVNQAFLRHPRRPGLTLDSKSRTCGTAVSVFSMSVFASDYSVCGWEKTRITSPVIFAIDLSGRVRL